MCSNQEVRNVTLLTEFYVYWYCHEHFTDPGSMLTFVMKNRTCPVCTA